MSETPRIALVTGGAQGIGRAITGVLLKEGYKVAILDIKEETGTKTAEDLSSQFGSGSCVFYNCDITESEKLRECYARITEELGSPSVVVNNAGLPCGANWTRNIDVSLDFAMLQQKAYIDLTYIAVEKMRKDKGGKGGIIVNMSSVTGLMGMPGTTVYGASKWGVIGFSQSMQASLDLAEEDWGICINTLCPYGVNTSLIEPYLKVNDGESEAPTGPVISPVVPQAECTNAIIEFVQETGMLSLEEVSEAFKRLLVERRRGAVMVVQKLKTGVRIEYIQQQWNPVM